MFCFEEYHHLVSTELADMIISEATSKNEDYNDSGLGATRKMTVTASMGSAGTATTKMIDKGAETTRYIQRGHHHLNRAKDHIDQGMLSLGQVLKMIQDSKPNATADDVSKAISTISMGIGGDRQNSKSHPMQRLLRVSDELEDLVNMLKTTERQVTKTPVRP